MTRIERINKLMSKDPIKLTNPASKHIYPIYEYFSYSHLPEHLQAISRPFHDIACNMINKQAGAYNEELNHGLRKLLEAKDCFVRANIKGKAKDSEEVVTHEYIGDRQIFPATNSPSLDVTIKRKANPTPIDSINKQHRIQG